jgi:nitrate reductase gamma subunit
MNLFLSAAFPQLDLLLFAVLPYLATILFIGVSISRYRGKPFGYSSLSSQFLENRKHFWGLVPFHYGLLIVLLGHLVAFLVPRSILAWNAVPLRLYILEVAALIFGLLTLVGLVVAMWRRATGNRLRVVSTPTDWILLWLLLLQTLTGIDVAMRHGWGSSWFAATLTPYLWSIVKLRPDLALVAAMPVMVKVHIVSAFVLIGFVSFTRIVHALVMPLMYLTRRPQVVRWNKVPGSRAE